MLLALLLPAALLLLPLPASARCNLAIEDWRRITIAMKDRYYYAYFRDQADCDLNYPISSSLIQQYGDCTSVTLSDAVKALGDTCETTLAQVLYVGYGQTQDTNVKLASDYCKDSLRDVIRDRLCDPLGVVGCPRALQLANFSPFANCFLDVLNMTEAQAHTFFSSGKDKECTQRKNVCPGINIWKDCPISLNETFNGLDHTGAWQCTRLFKTVLDRCQWSFKRLYDEVYCVPLPFLEQNGIWIGVGVGGGVLLIIIAVAAYLRCYRAHHISHEELLSQSMLSMHDSLHLGPSSSPGATSQKMYVHPEMHAAIAKASKYRGVQFDSTTNQWAANGRVYSNEMEAAQAAYILQAQQQQQQYLQQQQMMLMQQQQMQQQMMMQQQQQQQMMMQQQGSARFYQDSPGGYSPPAYQYQEQQQQQGSPNMQQMQMQQAPVEPPKPSPEMITQRRKEQLVQFYEYWDPDKPNIADHVENLFERHNFEHVARAVKTKYGLLPPGWEEELQ